MYSFNQHINKDLFIVSDEFSKWLRIHLQMQEMQVQSLGQEDFPEEEMATHSSVPAGKIPWTEEPGRLQSMGSQKVRHD